jgi:hypothetical protein
MTLRILVTAGATAALLWSAGFWDTKPYTQWSAKEVEKIMGDSPWSKTTMATVDLLKLKELASKMAPPESADAPGRPSGKGGGKGGGGPMPAMSPRYELGVRWQSSLTVRQAMVRGQFGDEAGASEKAQEFLARKQSFYVVAVTRLPARYIPRIDPREFQKMLAESATLNVPGLGAMKPADIQIQTSGQSATVYFAFPREQTITLEHKEAEFIGSIGAIDVKRKFRLAEMVREGKLDI